MAIVTARDTFSAEGQLSPNGAGGERIVDRAASSGSVRWAVPIPAIAPGVMAPLTVGTQVVVVNDPPAGGSATLMAIDQATGRRAWQARMPKTVWVPPAAAGPDLLVQPTDASYACGKDAVAGLGAGGALPV